MVNYKLTYFNIRARGEVTRLIFAAAGTEYEDHRVVFEDWPKLKPSTPFGQLPVLEVDGVQLCQSLAINRFLAKRLGLAGKNDLEEARVDMIVDCLQDFITPIIAIVTDKKMDDAVKEAKKKKLAEETLPECIEKYEKLLISNNGGDGYFVGDGLTWADLVFVHYFNGPALIGLSVDYSKAPKLKALKERVEALPKIAEWIKKRPDTPF